MPPGRETREQGTPGAGQEPGRQLGAPPCSPARPSHSVPPTPCARTCALQPAMWQPVGGPGGGCRRSPAQVGFRRARRTGPGLRAAGQGLGARDRDGAEVRWRGRGRTGAGGPAPPASSLTSAMAVCAREAVAARGSPDARSRAHWLLRPGRREDRGGA